MKKILFFFALLILAIGASAQTQVSILPSSEAGYVEAYPSIADITYDTTITYDNVGDVVDTVINVTEDTMFVPNFYVYRAIANPGYRFEKWEIITAHDSIYNADSNQWVDLVYSDTIIQFNIEITETDTLDYEGWLEWDQGIPDLNDTTIEGISSIVITAYFVQDSSVGIGEVTPQSRLVYPNPTTGTIQIQEDIQQVQVYDAFGRQVLKTSQRTVDLTSQPVGTYIIRTISATGKTNTVRVIKQ